MKLLVKSSNMFSQLKTLESRTELSRQQHHTGLLHLALVYSFLFISTCCLGNELNVPNSEEYSNYNPAIELPADSVLFPLSQEEAYHKYRIQNLTNLQYVNWLHKDFLLFLKERINHVWNSDMYILSKNIYSKYYANRIEVLSHKDKAFLYVSLKDAQRSQGAVQFKLALPDLTDLAKRKRKQQDFK